MKVAVIGLSGLIGAGKDTVADILVRDFGFAKQAFATCLRNEVNRQLAATDHSRFPEEISKILTARQGDLQCIYEKPTPPDVRRLLQWWGTEYRRRQDPDYWVKQAEAALPLSGRYVFTDVRFPNEHSLIKKLGGSSWKIERGAMTSRHISEWFAATFQGFDAVIENNGTIADLARDVQSLMSFEQ